MRLDQLPDSALRKMFVKCNAEDIRSLQKTNRKLNHHIQKNRLNYSKNKVAYMEIVSIENGISTIRLSHKYSFGSIKNVIGQLENVINQFNPVYFVISRDHEDLVNISPLWWKERSQIVLLDIVDYRRYLPHIDSCTDISIKSDFPKNLTEILQAMKTKHLRYFSLTGDGELECTDNDLRKIGNLSNKMAILDLESVSNLSNISNDAVLDMIEIGSFIDNASITISQVQDFENMEQRLKQRDWVVRYKRWDEHTIYIQITGGTTYRINT